MSQVPLSLGCSSGTWSLRASPSYTDRWALPWGSQGRGGPEELGHNDSLGLGLQVRRMTAVLVAVGLGALRPAQVRVILESRDPLGRHQTRVAPACGLFLKSVQYGSPGKGGWPGRVPAGTPPTDPLPGRGA